MANITRHSITKITFLLFRLFGDRTERRSQYKNAEELFSARLVFAKISWVKKSKRNGTGCLPGQECRLARPADPEQAGDGAGGRKAVQVMEHSTAAGLLAAMTPSPHRGAQSQHNTQLACPFAQLRKRTTSLVPKSSPIHLKCNQGVVWCPGPQGEVQRLCW